MVTYVKSYTTADVEYAVHVDAGIAESCSCKSRLYRTSKPCKHMVAIQQEIQAEVDRAARFLAVKLQVQGMEETWKANRDMAFDSRF
jgi:hypothetical protein